MSQAGGQSGRGGLVELYFISPDKTAVSKQADAVSMTDNSISVKVEQELEAGLSVMVKVIRTDGSDQVNLVARVIASVKSTDKHFEVALALIEPEPAAVARAKEWLGF